LLKSSGYRTLSFGSAKEFIEAGVFGHTQCLVSDIQMPEMDGIELCQYLISKNVYIPTILITAFPEAAVKPASGGLRILACLPKPCDAERLLVLISTACI
ncbi:response regulator, partial [Pseudomonas sp. KCJK8927]|uniref:response regulator n=1 Tax=Pseudomonas sp. KCJK8927 TaxID=3344560 RepID=UPI003906B3AE